MIKKRFYIYPYGYEFFVKPSTVAEIEKIYQGGKALYDIDNHTLVFDPAFWNPWMCAHECFHILSDIMTVRGLDWIANMNNEHLAYLLQDIYEQVWKATKRKGNDNKLREAGV